MSEIGHYMEFLRFCLHPEQIEPPSCVYLINWHSLLEFAKRQAIAGVYWQGIQRLGILKRNKPTDDDVMEWFSAYQKCVKRNKKLYEKAVWVACNFLKDGFRCCILKGQGNALMYPDPYSRTSGDIDVWVEGGSRRILKYILPMYKPKNVFYHHIDFNIIKNVPIEIHFRPSYFCNPFRNRKLQLFFIQEQCRQFENEIELPDNLGRIPYPTRDFNVIYQLIHIYRHFLGEGIGFRQIVDYYYLINGQSIDMLMVKRILDDLKMTKFASALLYVLHDWMGLNKNLFVEPNESEGTFLMSEIIRTGNFGRINQQFAKIKNSTSHLQRFFLKQKYYFRLLPRYPSEILWTPFYDFFIFLRLKYFNAKY